MKKIVVVEDEPLIRLSMEDALSRQGYCVIGFESSLEATAAVVTMDSPAACLVIDLRLPGINGWDLARIARQAFPGVPIVYTTGGDAPDISIQAVDNSAYLQKPFSEAALVTKIEQLICGANGLRHETVLPDQVGCSDPPVPLA